MSVIDKKEVTTAEAKRLLEEHEEELDPLQRRVLDYVTKFTKITEQNAVKLVQELTENDQLDRTIAVQIVNSMPSSIEEIRTFLGRQRIISEEKMISILQKVEKYRSNK